MPGMDGLLGHGGPVGSGPGPLIVVASSHATVESTVKAMKLGAVDCIRKLFTPEQLVELVTTVIAARRARELKRDGRTPLRRSRPSRP